MVKDVPLTDRNDHLVLSIFCGGSIWLSSKAAMTSYTHVALVGTFGLLSAIGSERAMPTEHDLSEKTWVMKTPGEVGRYSPRLDEFANFVGGRGCVVRHDSTVGTWGDASKRGDVASACKPWFTHFLFKAIENGKMASLDEKLVK